MQIRTASRLAQLASLMLVLFSVGCQKESEAIVSIGLMKGDILNFWAEGASAREIQNVPIFLPPCNC